MANFEPEIVNTYKQIRFVKEYQLTEGQKLSDFQDLLDMAQSTVPVGKKADVFVKITANLEDV